MNRTAFSLLALLYLILTLFSAFDAVIVHDSLMRSLFVLICIGANAKFWMIANKKPEKSAYLRHVS
jgi:hypothetical protein